jgi:hypothetical protein
MRHEGQIHIRHIVFAAELTGFNPRRGMFGLAQMAGMVAKGKLSM